MPVMDAWNQVTHNFIVGSEDHLYKASVADSLKLKGVTRVLDCRSQMENDFAIRSVRDYIDPTEHGWDITHLWGSDDAVPKEAAYFAEAIAWAQDVLDTRAVGLIHCLAGSNRAPSVMYAILRSPLYRLSRTRAEAAIRDVRPDVGLLYRADADQAIRQLYHV